MTSERQKVEQLRPL